MNHSTLYILSGLTGTGKTTIAKGLARKLKATHLRIDTIEQGLKDICEMKKVQGEGYRLSYLIAKDNLLAGNDVIADSVNPWELTRKEWNEVAISVDSHFTNIEIICSDQQIHKERIENREIDIKNLTPPTWEEVVNRDYDEWKMPRIQIDTANKSIKECIEEIERKLFDQIEEKMHEVYESNAAAFDSQRGKNLFEKKWLDRFLSLLIKKSNVLDVGCGSGDPIGKFLIENEIAVSGIDFSTNMVAMAQEKFPDNEWLVKDMRDFSLGTEFEGIIAWNSFFHLKKDDQIKALNCFSKHLKNNGILMMTIGHEKGEVTGFVNGAKVYHSSMTIDEYRKELNAVDLMIIDYQLKDEECHGHSILIARKVK